MTSIARSPAPTKLNRLEENLGAVEVELTPNDLREIESTASQITVEGARYPEELERLTNRSSGEKVCSPVALRSSPTSV